VLPLSLLLTATKQTTQGTRSTTTTAAEQAAKNI